MRRKPIQDVHTGLEELVIQKSAVIDNHFLPLSGSKQMMTTEESTQKLKTVALIVATTSSFIPPFMGSAINVALPAIEKALTIDAVLLSWVATAYLLATGISLVPFGRIADIYGRKKILFWGFLVYALSSIGCALSTSILLLLIFRVMQGIASGMIYATGFAILVSIFPPQERGKVLGITVSAVYLGLTSGPFIGGVLTQHLTWRSLFLLVAVLCIMVCVIIHWGLKKEWAEAAGEKLDIIGSVLYCIMLLVLIYGLSVVPAFNSIWLILIGLVGFVGFVKWETHTENPIFEVTLFKNNRTFAFSNLAALLHYSVTSATAFLLSLYLQHVRGLDPQSAGLVLIAQPITMALFSPLSGKLSDKIEPRYIASAGMALTCFVMFLFSMIERDTSMLQIIIYLLVLGFGFALFSSPNMNAIMSSVEKKYLGIASGSAGTMRTLGNVFAMGIATLVISIFIGRVHITAAVYENLIETVQTCFIISTILALLGLVASMVRGNLR